LSGFLGKLMILSASRGETLVWAAILLSSFVMILGLARAGSTLFWKSHAEGARPAPHDAQPLAFVAVGALLAGLVLLTVAAGPITGWLADTAAALQDPAAYIAANRLEGME
jgi:multicomponent K+:H+ antiporter subunit D